MSKIDNVRNAGREFVMSMAEKDGLDKTALYFGYVRRNGTGNGGALSNVIKDEGWRNDGDNGVKTTTLKTKPIIAVKTAPAPILTAIPGRIEDFMIDHILPDSWDDEKPIPQHFVELVVLSDTADWNKRVRRLGPDEIDMLEAFLGNKATMNRRENALLLEKAQAPYKASQMRIAAVAAIDAQLDSAANRFENSRYDVAIVAFYA